MAKYQQVADALREAITSGALPPASPLPSETELMIKYGVSRPTARAAISALRSEGLITVLHGKGSFVRRAGDRPSHTHAREIHSDNGGYLDADTDAPDWHVVEEPGRYRTNASAELALAMGVAEHTPAFVHDRLLEDSAGRRLLHRVYLPIAIAAAVPALKEDPFPTAGVLYRLLAEADHRLAWTEYIRARMPSPDDSGALRIPDATPMLLTRRVTRDIGTGTTLAMEESRRSSDDTQLEYQIQATQAVGVGRGGDA